jgi:hypothetical protein
MRFSHSGSSRSRLKGVITLGCALFCASACTLPSRAAWHPWNNEVAPPIDTLGCAKRNRVFYKGDAVVFSLAKAAKQSALLTTHFEARNYYGELVASGEVAAGTTATVSIPGLPSGWYKISFFGDADRSAGGTGYSAGPWGSATGGTTFCVLRPDPHFPTMPDAGAPNTDSKMYPNDEVARGVMALGPQRHSISATLSTNPNRFDIAKINSSVGVDVGLDRTWYLGQWQDSARPRAELGHFANGVPGFGAGDPDYAGLRQIVSNFKNDVRYWEPRNEPQQPFNPAAGKSFAQNEFKPFRDNVKMADPNAKVLAANTVSIGAGDLGWLAGFMQGGGDRMMDGFSFHAYNTVNGDLALGRRSMNGLQEFLTKYSLENVEKWQTEQGYMAVAHGSFKPRLQGRETMMQRMLFEQYNIPKEHDVMWYDRSHGFWDVPVWYENDDTSLDPAAPLMRVYSEELWGKTYTRALDFGPSGNNAAIGNVFSGGLVVLMSAGNTNGQVQLQNASGATATDAWGNPVSLSRDGNVTTVPVSELPVYVHGASADVEVVQPNWGPNIVRQPGVTVTAPGTGADKLNNGGMDTWYYSQSGSSVGGADAPWNAGATAPTDENPIAVEVNFPAAKTVRRVVIYAAPPWQNQSTLLDYDLQAWNGTGWDTLQTVHEPQNGQKVWTMATCTTYDSYFSDRWIFEHTFPAVTTTKLRVLVRRVTFGGAVNQDEFNAGEGSFRGQQRLVLREIEAYEDAPKIYSITGRIKDVRGDTLKGLAGVQVKLAGTSSATATTDAQGNYRFDNLRGGGDFSVVPAQSGQVFTPEKRTIANLSGDTTMDFHNPNGEGLSGDYYKRMNFEDFKVSRVDPQINFDWGYSGPMCGDLDAGACGNEPMQDKTGIGIGEFSVRWNGQIQPLSGETYTFRTRSDDGIRLWIDGQLLVDDFTSNGVREHTASIALEEGRKYNVRIEYMETNNTASMKLFWKTPTRPEEIVPMRDLYCAGKGTGLRGEYFDNPDFTSLKKTRLDRAVNFNWGANAPDPALTSPDTFSARWTGFLEPRASEDYTFYSQSDDGLRLWVDGRLLIDNWNSTVQTEQTSATIALKKGVKVPIKVEYFDDTANASVALKWSSPSQAKEFVPQSQLYPGGGEGVGAEYFDNADLSDSRQKRVDPQINFDWGLGSPDSSVGAETFSARWKGRIEPWFSESYTFSTLSDERVRLWVNGQLLIDNWNDHTSTEEAGTPITLVAGQKYDLKMEFADIRSFAQAKLFWQSASQAKEVVPQSQLYPVTNEPPTVALTSPSVSVNSRLSTGDTNFFVGDTIPIAATASDSDGSLAKVEFWANGAKIGEDATAPYELAWSGASAGQVSIVAKAIDDVGDAGQSAPVIVTVDALGTGLRGEYFDDENFSQPKLVRVDPRIAFDWGLGSPDPGMGVDTFSIRWTGEIRAPKTEAFTFYSLVDDGARVWVDGQLISERWPYGGSELISKPVNLVAGRKYAIKIEFHEGIIHSKARLSWSSATTPKAVVPATFLYPASADQPTVSVTAPDSSLGETPGQTGMWRLTRTGSTAAPLSVNIALDGSAVNGVDYDLSPAVTGNNGTFVIPAGQAFVDIAITPRDDAVYEGTEQARMTPLPSANYTPGTGNTVSIADNDTVSVLKVNFQPAGALTAPGYEVDSGAKFAEHTTTSFGWDAATTTFDRDSPASPDQRYDTLALLQGGIATKWEALVPNGTYTVRIVAGDPNFFDGTFKVMAENVLVVNGSQSSTGDTRWVEGTATVTVNDGRLTLSSGTGAQNNKLCFVEITRQ